MHSKLTIYWDDDDPYSVAKLIEEAFNRVISFCHELENPAKREDRSRELIAFNRITGNEFDLGDVTTLMTYAQTIHKRIAHKYGHSDTDLARSIMQAANNVVSTMLNASGYIMACLAASSMNTGTLKK